MITSATGCPSSLRIWASSTSRDQTKPSAHRRRRWRNSILPLLKPILTKEAVDPGELPLVVGDDSIAKCDGLSGNEQIVTADRSADLFEPGADQAISGIGGHLEGENVQGAKHRRELRREPWRSFLRSPVV